MSVIKRGQRWYVTFRYPHPETGASTRFRRTTGIGTTKREALRLEAEWRQEVMRPPEREVQAVKVAGFAGFAKHWFDTHVTVNLKPTTQRAYRRVLRRQLAPAFGDTDLRQIDAEAVETFKARQVAQGLAPKTVNNRIGVLRRLMGDAVRWGYADMNPCVDVAQVPSGPRSHRFWAREQSDRFLDAVLSADPRWHAYMATAILAGLRAGELCALDWEHLDLVRREIRVRQSFSEGHLTTPKHGKTRDVPIPIRLAEILAQHPRHLQTPAVFHRPHPIDGRWRHFTNDGWHVLQRGIRRAELPRIAFHDLRHSYASQLAMAGVPLQAIQEYLGHSDIKMTQRYAHLSPSARASYVGVLDEPASSVPKMSPNGHSQRGPLKEKSV